MIMQHHAQTQEIWSQMHQRLLSYIRGRVATPHDAEDILQDVFVRIHANLKRLRGPESVTGWIYRITRNAITDYHRKRAAGDRAIAQLAEDADEADEPTPDVTATATAEFTRCLEPLRLLPAGPAWEHVEINGETVALRQDESWFYLDDPQVW